LFGAENAVLRPVAYKLEGRRAQRRSKAAKPGLEPRARCEASEHGEAPPFDRSEHGGTLERRGGVTPLVGLLVAKVGLAGGIRSDRWSTCTFGTSKPVGLWRPPGKTPSVMRNGERPPKGRPQAASVMRNRPA
jgi:hypothetical protein